MHRHVAGALNVPRWPCLGDDGTGCTLRVTVVPQAGRNAMAGLHDGLLRVRVAAPAIDGRANAAVTAWLADQLGLPKRAVTVVQGASSRRKRLRLDCPRAQVEAWLDAAAAAWSDG